MSLNGMESAIQSNTTEGDVSLIANGAITEGFLCKLSTVASGETRVILPSDQADECQFVALSSAATGAAVSLRPIAMALPVRMIAAGTIAGGDRVVLSGTFGKVMTITGAAADTYFSPGVAETDATVNGYVRVRISPKFGIVVS